MKNHRLISIFALLMALTLVFCGCGGSSVAYKTAASSAPAASAPMAAPMAPMPAGKYDSFDMEAAEIEEMGIVTTASNSSGAALPADRKIVKHSNMELETKDFDTAFAAIMEVVSKSGGYVESQSVSGQSIRYNDDYYERSASINARIPAAKLDEVTGSIGGICNITSHWEGIDDITDTYFDTDARLKSLELQEERLLDILSKAEKLEDIITLEAKLSDVRYEIESLTARIRRMDSQVAYSYLNMNLREVVEYKQVSAAPKSFGERISDAFARSGKKLENFFEDTVIFIIEDFPLMLIHIVIFAAVVVILVKAVGWVIVKMGGSPKKKLFSVKKKAEAAPEKEPTDK